MIRTIRCIAVSVLVVLASGLGHAAPSKELRVFLNTKVPASEMEEHSLSNAVSHLQWRCRELKMGFIPRFGVEYTDDEMRAQVSPCKTEATLREHLNQLAKSAGYVWFVNGDWVNLVPKRLAFDPDYCMNKRIPGKLVMSRDSWSAGAAVAADWIRRNHIDTARVYCGMTFKGLGDPICPDPTILVNPTLREQFNIHESLYGNGSWLTYIRETRDSSGKCLGACIQVSSSRLYPPVITTDSAGKTQQL